MFNRSPWCVKRRALVLAGYRLIGISLGEVNKRFCQSTAVMQKSGRWLLSPAASIFLMPAGRAPGPAHMAVCWTYRIWPVPFFFKWAVKLARLINPFTMFLKDAAPVCECCRKSVEVSALVILSSLVRYFVCIHCALHQSVWLVFYNHYSTFIPLMMYGCSVVFTCMCMGGSWHYMRSLWMSGVLWIVVPVLQKVVLSSTSYTLPDLLLHAPGLFMHHS